jgi:hypothetical protein
MPLYNKLGYLINFSSKINNNRTRSYLDLILKFYRVKFRAHYLAPYCSKYRCPISTRPASPARSPLFGPGPSPARPGSMRARAGPARISGPGSDKKLGTVG